MNRKLTRSAVYIWPVPSVYTWWSTIIISLFADLCNIQISRVDRKQVTTFSFQVPLYKTMEDSKLTLSNICCDSVQLWWNGVAAVSHRSTFIRNIRNIILLLVDPAIESLLESNIAINASSHQCWGWVLEYEVTAITTAAAMVPTKLITATICSNGRLWGNNLADHFPNNSSKIA